MTLSNNESNENGKETGFDQQNNSFARVSRFFVHFFALVARPRRETS